MKRLLALLLLCVLLCSAALAESALEAPFVPDSAGAAVAAAAADALGLSLRLTEEADPGAAADAMLASPGLLLCADQAVLIAGLQGYTSADLRTAMRPVCRIASCPLYLAADAAMAEEMGFSDAEGLLALIAENEYELTFARHISADVIDRAVTKLADGIAVLTEYYLEDEIADVLASGEAQAAVITGDRLAADDGSLLPLCSLGAERTADRPDLPCAAELGIPVCDGVLVWILASADTPDETVQKAADTCLAIAPESFGAAPGYVFAPLSGEDAAEEIARVFADYKEYMTSEGLFFYEE